MSWRTRRDSQGLEQLVNSQLDTWRSRAQQNGYRVGDLSLSQWWDITLPEIGSLIDERELARDGDMDAAGRAQIGYRSMALSCEWIHSPDDQLAAATACIASYEAVDAEARAALGETATGDSGLPTYVESMVAASDAWNRLLALTMQSDESRDEDAEQSISRSTTPTIGHRNRPVGLTGGQHHSIKKMMQDCAAPETVSALLSAARDPNAVVTIREDYPGGLIYVSMSTTTPGVGMVVMWAPAVYRKEWLQTTESRPCDGFKVTLMHNDGTIEGRTFVGPADLSGMTGEISGRVDYLRHKFRDDRQRVGRKRVKAWS